MSKTKPPTAPAAPPATEPLSRGRYALYATPDGGFHLALRLDGSDVDQHIPVPAHLIKMANMLGGGKINPAALIRRLTGQRGGPVAEEDTSGME